MTEIKKLNLDNLTVGNEYSTLEIVSLAGMKNPRAVGIMTIGPEPNYKAIIVKATLSGGKYANAWITKNEELKYYMFALKGKYNPDYKVNKAIINSQGIPIYVFTREIQSGPFVLSGIFEYVDYTREEDNSKWFRLKKISSWKNNVIENKNYELQLEYQVKEARKISKKKLNQRLAAAPKKPEQTQIISTGYKRNPDVIVAVLDRANGICERCHKPAPFYRASDNTPYLEVHHVIPLSENGDDTVENAIALCPNCHREMHFGRKKV